MRGAIYRKPVHAGHRYVRTWGSEYNNHVTAKISRVKPMTGKRSKFMMGRSRIGLQGRFPPQYPAPDPNGNARDRFEKQNAYGFMGCLHGTCPTQKQFQFTHLRKVGSPVRMSILGATFDYWRLTVIVETELQTRFSTRLLSSRAAYESRSLPTRARAFGRGTPPTPSACQPDP